MIRSFRPPALALGLMSLTIAACSPQADDPSAVEPDPPAPAASAEPAMARTAFTDAETKMHEAMMGAHGADVSETWARKMIPHHQGALDMSEIVMRQGQDADIRRMAQKAIEMQTQDIAELRRWLEGRASGAAGLPPQGPFEPVEARMKEAMAAASGADADHLWVRKMIAHHQGALDMGRIALEDTEDAEVRRMAQKTVEMQTRDIRELEAWLEAHPEPAAG
jgi:uncharacterized protein (DUF305 family)